jgi:outer membrane protein assembly factor BamB
VAGDRVYFGSMDGRVYALGLADGKLVWEHETGDAFTGSPAIADGRLVIADTSGVVYCFGAK